MASKASSPIEKVVFPKQPEFPQYLSVDTKTSGTVPSALSSIGEQSQSGLSTLTKTTQYQAVADPYAVLMYGVELGGMREQIKICQRDDEQVMKKLKELEENLIFCIWIGKIVKFLKDNFKRFIHG